jgi:long-chain acyl-CoA synthetase
MEVKIADDGEVICRGGNVFQGYFKQPDKTAETIVDGWLHSGDIGEIDDEGYIKIVDRKKELIITSGGKNISPANLEAALKTIPLVGQAAAIGDNASSCRRSSCSTPRPPVWAEGERQGITVTRRAVGRPDVIAEVQAGVDEINEQFAQVEQIKKFTLSARSGCPTARCSPRRRSSSVGASTPATPRRSRRCTPDRPRGRRGSVRS